MTLTEVTSIGASILFSLGGGAAIIFALSSWLGKVWAERLMEAERHSYAVKFEGLRDSLQLASEKQLAALRAQLDISKEAQVQEHSDRVAIYRGTVDLIAGMVAKIQMILLKKRGPLTADELHEFEVQRLRVYAYLAMHAPQSVMDAHDALTGVIFEVIYDGKTPTWKYFRELSLAFLNEVRKDIGIRADPVAYQGAR